MEKQFYNERLRPYIKDENGNEKSLTWADIKSFVNSLSKGELQQRVIVWGDEKGGAVYSITDLNDDFINPSGDGVEPRFVYKDDPDYEDEETVYSKGQLILNVDF